MRNKIGFFWLGYDYLDCMILEIVEILCEIWKMFWGIFEIKWEEMVLIFVENMIGVLKYR